MEHRNGDPREVPGLARLNRRRRRYRRNLRRYGGKDIFTTREYKAVHIRATGDHSAKNRWVYAALISAAPFIPFLLIALMIFTNPLPGAETPEYWVKAIFFMVFLICAMLLMLGLCTAVSYLLEKNRQKAA